MKTGDQVGGHEALTVARYLDVLGVDARDIEPGTVSSLVRLHRAQAVRFCHDTIWMSRGRVPPVRYEPLVRALIAGEGGACINLNASLAWLLRELGFEVAVHRARVVQGFVDTPSELDSHMVLEVGTEDGPWLADTGLGAGLLDPLPLRAGRYQQGSYVFVLEESDEPGLAYHLAIDRRLMGVRSVEWERASSELPALEAAYEHDARDPGSPYVQHLTAHIRTEGGSAVLNARVLTRVDDRRRTLERIADAGRWEQVLRQVFHLSLPELSEDELEELWRKTGEDTGAFL